MADVITPDTFSGAFEMPATIGGGRMPRFTKEDLVRALLQTQAQPKGPYSLQFEAPVIVGGAPDREQQFQQDWDAAMQAYQQGLGNLKTNLPGFTYEGKTAIEHTPQELFNQYLAPLRFQAAEFAPDVARAFTAEDVARAREAQAKHWEDLAKQSAIREQRYTQQAIDKANKPKKPPSKDEIDTLNEYPESWPDFESFHGPGSAALYLRPEATKPEEFSAQPSVPQALPPKPPIMQSFAGASAPFGQVPQFMQPQETPTMPRPTVLFGRGRTPTPVTPAADDVVIMVNSKGQTVKVPRSREDWARSKGYTRQ